MEAYVVYNAASGDAQFQNIGQAGSSYDLAATLAEGLSVVVVPFAAINSVDGAVTLDLAPVRTSFAATIDAQAETVRLAFITPGAGQAMTYYYKANEAAAWAANHDAATPFLSAEAKARGKTLAEVAGEVHAQVAAWTAVGSAIEAARLGAKAGIAAAANIGGIVKASTVDWAAVTGGL